MSHPYGLITPTAASDPCFFPVFFRVLGCGTGVPGCGVIHTTNKRWQRQHDAAHRRTTKRVRVSCGMIAMGHPITIPLSNRYHTECALCGKVSGYVSQVRQETRNGGVFPSPNDPRRKRSPGRGGSVRTRTLSNAQKRTRAQKSMPHNQMLCFPEFPFRLLPGTPCPGAIEAISYGGDEVESTASSQRTPKKGRERQCFSIPFPTRMHSPIQGPGIPCSLRMEKRGVFECGKHWLGPYCVMLVWQFVRLQRASFAQFGVRRATMEGKRLWWHLFAGLFC